MSHMRKQIKYSRWFRVETNIGTEFIEQDIIGKTTNPDHSELLSFLEGNKIYSVELIDGYGARLSAPGYSDCADWTVYETRDKAIKGLNFMYDDEDEELELYEI